jgi:hypothetical protein
MNPDNAGMRYGYSIYRVFVDLMGSKNLGGKTLLYFMDGLWATSYEHQKPQKFVSAPFNNDWCSSFILSMDPVAIESVCLDILQKEFSKEDLTANPPRYAYVQWDGVDDYLHQAASSDWWPKGIVYDPDNSGTPLKSLGVHEHWNNPENMKYSRNLGTGNGIELKYVIPGATAISLKPIEKINIASPNPFSNFTRFKRPSQVSSDSKLEIYNSNGQLIKSFSFTDADIIYWNGTDTGNRAVTNGLYVYKIHDNFNHSGFVGKVVLKK